MPKRLLNRRDVPRGNYDYLVKETGHAFASHVFMQLVVQVRDHMAANAITPPNDLALIIEDDFCTRKPEYCRDTDAVRINGEDALTQVVAALAIPAADALHAVAGVLGIDCATCNRRRLIIKEIKKVGVAETLRRLKGTFSNG